MKNERQSREFERPVLTVGLGESIALWDVVGDNPHDVHVQVDSPGLKEVPFQLRLVHRVGDNRQEITRELVIASDTPKLKEQGAIRSGVRRVGFLEFGEKFVPHREDLMQRFRVHELREEGRLEHNPDWVKIAHGRVVFSFEIPTGDLQRMDKRIRFILAD